MFDFAMKMFARFGSVYTEDCAAICAGSGMGSVPPNNMFVPQIPQQQICSCYPVGSYPGGGYPSQPGFYPPQPQYPSYLQPQYPVSPTPQYPVSPTPTPQQPPQKTTKVDCNTSSFVVCNSCVEDVPPATVLPPPQQASVPVYVPAPVPVVPVMPATPVTPQPAPQQPVQPTYQQPVYTSYPQQPVQPSGTGQSSVPGYSNVNGRPIVISSDCLSNCTINESQQTKPVRVNKPTQVIIENQPQQSTSSGCICVPPSGSISSGGSFVGSSGSSEMCVAKSEHNIYEDCLSNGGINYETVGTVQIPKMDLTPVSGTSISCVC